MRRRAFLATALAAANTHSLPAVVAEGRWDDATEVLERATAAKQVIRNHNPAAITPRGLGFAVGGESGSRGCSARTFGHTGSTGTLCWADPASDTICVALTSLPGRAVKPHPRDLAADRVVAAAHR